MRFCFADTFLSYLKHFCYYFNWNAGNSSILNHPLPPPSLLSVYNHSATRQPKIASGFQTNERHVPSTNLLNNYLGTQGCSLASPWHSLICSGVHSSGLPLSFSGCSQTFFFSFCILLSPPNILPFSNLVHCTTDCA